MDLLNSILKVFVGDKKKKDLKILLPIVEKVNAFESAITSLSNDGLRDKTLEFKTKIKAATAPFQKEIETLEEETKSANIDRKEEIYNQIDALQDESYEASEKCLDDILPEAFALIKETAKRFTQNKTIEVEIGRAHV